MKRIQIAFPLVFVVSCAFSQNYKFEVVARTSYLTYETNASNRGRIEFYGFSGELNYYLKPRFGIGLGYFNDQHKLYVTNTIKYSSYDIHALFTTSRDRTHRAYASIGFVYATQSLEGFSNPPSGGFFQSNGGGSGIALGGGIVINLSRVICLNLLDIKVLGYDKSFSLSQENTQYAYLLSSGLLVKIWRQK